MRLSDLLRSLDAGAQLGAPDGDPVIRGLCYDSRAVAAGDLFFALRGEAHDGHAYVSQALGLGAAALVVEDPDVDTGGRPRAVVRDSRRALAPIARAFYGDPSSELSLIGVTGTNGKTSVTYLVESMLQKAARRVGIVGTVETRWPGERHRSLNTTPESLDLQRTLRSMRTHDVEAVVMEVSSHGLELGRVAGCRFAVGAFTNLTQDHLDFHETMDAYRDSKTLLFQRHLRVDGRAVVNVDDPSADAFLAAARGAGAQLIRVSRDAASDADVALEDVEIRMDGTSARLRLPSGALEIDTPLVGDFNVENLLVAAGIGVALDLGPGAIAAGAAACPQVPGRAERIPCDDPRAPAVLIDYAHTPDAVEKLVRTLRPLTPGNLVTVFGCGGDRDRSKRPMMAEAVARWSDRVVATSDNPRTEDPARILDDVERGLDPRERVEPDALGRSKSAYTILVDRRQAIELAIDIAGAGDVVVIAGKGHEDYQIIGHERLPFSDGDEARRCLEQRFGG